jgi:hypothetical protein
MGSRNESEDSDLSELARSFLLISEVDLGADGRQDVRKIGYIQDRRFTKQDIYQQEVQTTEGSQDKRFLTQDIHNPGDFVKQQLYMYSTRSRGKDRVVQMALSLWKYETWWARRGMKRYGVKNAAAT